MTWVDIVLLILIICLFVHGIVVGLIRSVFDVVGIVTGYILAVNFHNLLKMPKFLAFLLIFVIVIIAVSLLGRFVSRLIRHTPLRSVDRLLGGILGIIKGLIVGFVFLLVLLLLRRSDSIIKESYIAPVILKSGIYGSQLLPRNWYDRIKKIALPSKQMLVQKKEQSEQP